jgi:putative transposase
MNEKRYPSDLTLREWATIQPLFPRAKRRGRPSKHSKKGIVNGILYVVRTGCQWYALPNDYPPYKTVYDWFAKWTRSGLWGRLLKRLNERVRVRAGREPEPSAVIIDSQSVKSGGISEDVGFDGGKGINGRKRHILVDVLGLLFGVSVTAASVQDRDEAERIFEALEDDMPRLEKIWADGGYTGKLADYLLGGLGWDLEIITPTKAEPGFHVRPWCWIVERTFGWLTKQRRLSKDYERSTAASEALIRVAMIGNMARRLAQPA